MQLRWVGGCHLLPLWLVSKLMSHFSVSTDMIGKWLDPSHPYFIRCFSKNRCKLLSEKHLSSLSPAHHNQNKVLLKTCALLGLIKLQSYFWQLPANWSFNSLEGHRTSRIISGKENSALKTVCQRAGQGSWFHPASAVYLSNFIIRAAM